MATQHLFRRVVHYFLQGMLVLAPVAITVYATYKLVTSIDDLIPILTITNEKGEVIQDQYGRPSVIAVSNCGNFRIAIYEYPRARFW